MRDTRFVGRATELEALERALSDAEAGRGRFVLLEGEPGIGKTTIARRFLDGARERGARVGLGRAWEGGGAPAWFVWTEAVRAAAQEPSEHLALPRTVSDEARFVCLEQIADHVVMLAAKAPLVLVLDDLQWADPASLLALRLLARRIDASPLVLVGTLRGAQEHGADIAPLIADVRREATTLAVAGLSDEELGQLARARGVVSESAGAALRAATAGNALYAEELLLEEETRKCLAEGRPPPLTRNVGIMLARHLGRLEGDLGTIACAALGPQPTRDVELAAARGVPVDDVARAIARAVDVGVMTRAGDGVARFAHDLLRRAAVDTIPAGEVREHHERWGRALASRGAERAVARARHLVAADPEATSEDASDAALDAARVARTALAYEEAAWLAERAAERYERAGRTAKLGDALGLLAEARFDAGDTASGMATAERALTVARTEGNAQLFARSALVVGRRRLVAMSDAPLTKLLDEALTGLEKARAETPESTALRCRVEARLACALQPDGDPQRALRLARGAIARARDSGDRALYARVLHGARPAFRILEDLDERLNVDRELLGVIELLGDEALAIDAHARLLRSAVEAGDAHLVAHHAAEYERLAKKLRLADHELGLACSRIMFAALRGELETARSIVDDLARTRETWAPRLTAAPPIDPLVMSRLAVVSAADDPGAFRQMAKQLASAPIPPQVRHTFLAILHSRAGDLDGAREAYEAVVAHAMQPKAGYTFRVGLGETCIHLRDTERAPRFYEVLKEFAGRHVVWLPFWMYDGSIDRLLGGLAALSGKDETARAHFAQAVAAEEALGATAFVPRTIRMRDALLGAAAAAAAAAGRPSAAPPRAPTRPSSDGPTLALEGETWLVSLGDERARLKDADGLHYLSMLLDRPDVPISAMELLASRRSTDEPAPRSGDAGEVLDARAIAAYRARARELQETIEEAEARNDLGALDAARRELSFLEVEVSRAVGLGGKARRGGSDAERVRVNVTTRIRKAIERIREHAPLLADHLSRSIRTGTTCVYAPPPTSARR